MASNGIFDITTPEQFFDSIRTIFEDYKSSNAKSVEKLLYVIMGLNHLREWIAPGYNHKNPAQDEAQKFYNLIWDVPSYKIIKEISNLTKHLAARGRSLISGPTPPKMLRCAL